MDHWNAAGSYRGTSAATLISAGLDAAGSGQLRGNQMRGERHGEHVTMKEYNDTAKPASEARPIPKAPMPAALLCLALLGGSD